MSERYFLIKQYSEKSSYVKLLDVNECRVMCISKERYRLLVSNRLVVKSMARLVKYLTTKYKVVVKQEEIEEVQDFICDGTAEKEILLKVFREKQKKLSKELGTHSMSQSA